MRHGLVFSLRRNKNYFLIVVTTVYGLLMASSLWAQLDDPTLPPDGVASIATKDTDAATTTWKLSSILMSAQRSIAIINGQSVQVGDTLAGARVESINKTIVKLKHRGKVISLELFPVAVKTVHEE